MSKTKTCSLTKVRGGLTEEHYIYIINLLEVIWEKTLKLSKNAWSFWYCDYLR